MRIVVMYNFRYMRDFRLISVYTLESHSQSYYGRNGRSRNHGIIYTHWSRACVGFPARWRDERFIARNDANL